MALKNIILKGMGWIMERPSWLNNKTATIFGIIFFSVYVIFAYRLNTYALRGEVMSGGRLFWRELGWSFLCSIPLVGWIYGFVKLDDIIETRNRLWDVINGVQPQPMYQPPPPPPQ